MRTCISKKWSIGNGKWGTALAIFNVFHIFQPLESPVPQCLPASKFVKPVFFPIWSFIVASWQFFKSLSAKSGSAAQDLVLLVLLQSSKSQLFSGTKIIKFNEFSSHVMVHFLLNHQWMSFGRDIISKAIWFFAHLKFHAPSLKPFGTLHMLDAPKHITCGILNFFYTLKKFGAFRSLDTFKKKKWPLRKETLKKFAKKCIGVGLFCKFLKLWFYFSHRV